MLPSKPMTAILGLAIVSLAAGSVTADDTPKLDDRTSRINYSLGYQIGGDFQRQGIEIDAEAVVRGIEDALSGVEPLMPQKAMNGILMELKRKVVDDERKKSGQNRAEKELQYLAEGETFMAENASRPGVQTTASGLQYTIIDAGTGKAPQPSDEVTVNYRGTLVDGNEFDSSYKRGEPSSFNLSGVIKGWTEGLQLIGEGGKIQLFLPPKLAYGDRGPLAHRTLVFDVELIAVGGNKQVASANQDQPQGKQ